MPFDTLAADLLVILGKHAQAGRFSPIFFIRESNVVGFTPRSSAAPSAPLIFQLALSRTAARFSRSRCSISGSVRNSAIQYWRKLQLRRFCVASGAFLFELLFRAQRVIEFVARRATAHHEDLMSALPNFLERWRSSGSRLCFLFY